MGNKGSKVLADIKAASGVFRTGARSWKGERSWGSGALCPTLVPLVKWGLWPGTQLLQGKYLLFSAEFQLHGDMKEKCRKAGF